MMARLGALLLVLCGCAADSEPDPVQVDCPETGRYLPMRTGASWTYRVTDDNGDMTEKTQTVGAEEDVGGAKVGTLAFRVETTKAGGTVTSWQEDTGDGVIRHHERDASGTTATDEWYEPYRTRISESTAHVTAGAAWSEDYTESVTDLATNLTTTASKTERWEVVAVDEVVSVPAGDFCAMRVHRTSTVGGVPGSDKTYWFARDVGKVKETGATQTEELVEYR